MKKRVLVIVGLGQLGRACLHASPRDDPDLVLGGVVRRPDAARVDDLPANVPVVAHVRDLPAVDVALCCVPASVATGVACELLQAGIPVVECAQLEGAVLHEHVGQVDHAARKHRVAAVVGAGWDPGMLQVLTRAFRVLVPHGRETLERAPGLALYHSAALSHIDGVAGAVAGQFHQPGVAPRRYVYVEPQPGADFAAIREQVLIDPLFAGVPTEVFEVASLAELEHEQGQGLLLERVSDARRGMHASLMFEARLQPADFAARVMLDAARHLPGQPPGAHSYGVFSSSITHPGSQPEKPVQTRR